MRMYKEGEKAYLEDNGEVVEVTKTWFEKAKNKWWYILPKNSLNRTYVSVDKLEREQEIDLGNTVHVARVLGSSGKNWQEYMTEEEKAQYEQAQAVIAGIEQACKDRKAADKVAPKTEKEKLLEKIAKLQAQVAKYEAQ